MTPTKVKKNYNKIAIIRKKQVTDRKIAKNRFTLATLINKY